MFVSATVNENLYSKSAIMRASAICTSCINFIRYSALKLAVEKHIPMLIFGWAPGQTLLAGMEKTYAWIAKQVKLEK